MDLALVAFGLGVGVLVGMTGIGGGSLMTPMLILVFGVAPVTAIGTDLAYAAVTKTVGGYKHWSQKTVDMRLSGWMAIGSVPAAVGGVYALGLLEDLAGRDFDDLVITLLAGTLLLTGAATLIRAFLKSMHARERDTIDLERRHKVAAVLLGLSVGFVLGVTSRGGDRALPGRGDRAAGRDDRARAAREGGAGAGRARRARTPSGRSGKHLGLRPG
ncbi:MAG: sulfite exporter TauE/SafE family protein [Actinomycetota bacterium]|nr:sulfite exporter TauE/SafE family protein [Actinomycetota bacterium]